MKYVSCRSIEYGVVFLANSIKPCAPGKEIFFASDYNGELLDTDAYLEAREKYRNMFKSGELPNQCKDCGCLEEKEWPENSPISYIGVNNRTKCSCNCFYCTFAEEKEYWNTLKTYNILPILQDLTDKKIVQGATLDIAGGECTEYDNNELEDIVEFALENKFWLHLFSSGIRYSKAVEEVLNKGIANIIISVDSGTRETYKKIKRVDCHDKVWGNIQNYIKAATINESCTKGYVILKYIIVPGVNDNINECRAFIEKCKQVGCKYIRLSVEYDWFNKNKGNIPPHIYELTEFFDSYDKEFILEYIEDAVNLKQLCSQATII